MMTIQEKRTACVREALTWERTPFVWGAAIKGVGADCGRYAAAVGNAAGVKNIDMNSFPEMSPQWFLHEHRTSPFIEQILRFSVEYKLAKDAKADETMPVKAIPQPSDIVVAKFFHDWAHSAIVIDWPTIIGSAGGYCVTRWNNIYLSPQYGHRALRFFDPFHPDAGGNVSDV